MTDRRFWWTVTLGALTVVGLPVLGTWSRRNRLPRCDLDGAAIEPIYAVEVVDAQGKDHEFCCLLCAEFWLKQQTNPAREVRVVDEVSGRPIAADAAFYVRSTIVTNRTTGNRVHVFRERGDAEVHASTRSGKLLTGTARPFGGDDQASDAQ
ncbi:MAG TPA: hypothetical protein VGX78_16045 [Pirellulales bacterium]|jgi:hypothetical protein|nr:hypothetical protein [Pirellulales bacterium]